MNKVDQFWELHSYNNNIIKKTHRAPLYDDGAQCGYRQHF